MSHRTATHIIVVVVDCGL